MFEEDVEGALEELVVRREADWKPKGDTRSSVESFICLHRVHSAVRAHPSRQ